MIKYFYRDKEYDIEYDSNQFNHLTTSGTILYLIILFILSFRILNSSLRIDKLSEKSLKIDVV